MLSELIIALRRAIKDNDAEAKRRALRALECVGVDNYTALYLASDHALISDYKGRN